MRGARGSSFGGVFIQAQDAIAAGRFRSYERISVATAMRLIPMLDPATVAAIVSTGDDFEVPHRGLEDWRKELAYRAADPDAPCRSCGGPHLEDRCGGTGRLMCGDCSTPLSSHHPFQHLPAEVPMRSPAVRTGTLVAV